MRVWPQPCRAAVPCVSRCFSAGCLFIRCQCLIVFMFNSVELQPCLALSRARARIVCGNCARPSENFPRLRIAQIVRHATAPLVRVGPSKRRKASVLYACACACARARACTGGAAFCSRTGRAAAQPQTRAPAASGVFGFARFRQRPGPRAASQKRLARARPKTDPSLGAPPLSGPAVPLFGAGARAAAGACGDNRSVGSN